MKELYLKAKEKIEILEKKFFVNDKVRQLYEDWEYILEDGTWEYLYTDLDELVTEERIEDINEWNNKRLQEREDILLTIDCKIDAETKEIFKKLENIYYERKSKKDFKDFIEEYRMIYDLCRRFEIVEYEKNRIKKMQEWEEEIRRQEQEWEEEKRRQEKEFEKLGGKEFESLEELEEGVPF